MTTRHADVRRIAWIAAGGAFALLAFVLPGVYADAGAVPPGPRLARLFLGVSALACMAWAAFGRPIAVAPGDRLPVSGRVGVDLARPLPWLIALTAVAAALRVPGLGTELWFDELRTALDLDRLGPLELVAAPHTSNNHLLYALTIRATAAVFGFHEWAIRLPALVFGAATVPAVYALARLALRSREALLAAAMVAVSWHHVLFSQNARGYTALLLWTALSTLFLYRALIGDRGRDWALYGGTLFLAAATYLFGGFVGIGHALALPVVAARIARAGGNPWRAVGKAAGVMVATGLAALDLLAVALPSVLDDAPLEGETGVGAADASDLVAILDANLRAGFGTVGLILLAVASVVLLPGALRFLRRRPAYAAFLVAPAAAVLLVLPFDLQTPPRHYLWGIVALAIGGTAAAASLPRLARAAPIALAGLVALFSLLALPALYRTPKQTTREAVRWIHERASPGDVLAAVRPARRITTFYAPRLGTDATLRIVRVDSLSHLVAAETLGRPVWALTTYAWEMRGLPLEARLERCYRRVREYPATIYRMETAVWRGPSCPTGGDEARSDEDG